MRPMVKEVAEAMEAKRRELINQPLARIWPELAQVAVDVQRKWIENSLFERVVNEQAEASPDA